MDQFDVIVIGAGPFADCRPPVSPSRPPRAAFERAVSSTHRRVADSHSPFTSPSALPTGFAVGAPRITACSSSRSRCASQPFYFFNTIHHECSQTWQVWRGEFDQMLLDNAVKKGVTLRQHVTVRDVLMEGSRVVGVRADTKDGVRGEEIRAKVVVDATGRDSLLSRKFAWKDKDPDLNKIAVWSYFEGALRDPGLHDGATTVAYVPRKGWFWYIPPTSNTVSVGVVGEPWLFVPRHSRSRTRFPAKSRTAPGFANA